MARCHGNAGERVPVCFVGHAVRRGALLRPWLRMGAHGSWAEVMAPLPLVADGNQGNFTVRNAFVLQKKEEQHSNELLSCLVLFCSVHCWQGEKAKLMLPYQSLGRAEFYFPGPLQGPFVHLGEVNMGG